MTIETIDGRHPDPELLARAAGMLRAGHLVAFPTETVYGLGAHALDPAAVARIYAAKGRPAYNPLIVHVPDVAAARRLTREWPEEADRLAARWWPGPLTFVLPKSANVPDAVTAGLDTVALRVPAHPVALALLQVAGIPLAAPSANRSGQVSPTMAVHVARGLGGRVPLILDGGACQVGIESTVVDLSAEPPVLLRPGMVSQRELEEELGRLALPAAPHSHAAPRPSPGMLERHYAPAAAVRLFERGAVEATRVIADDVRARGGKVGALVCEARPTADQTIILPDDPAGYARSLYQSLHVLDAAGVELILIEQPPASGEWAAVRDRLERAARE
ncbi:MAG: L-threonylcarbamoyladenylate synthase [Gemmatimonadales bacterium]